MRAASVISAASHKNSFVPYVSGVGLLYRQPRQFCETYAEVTRHALFHVGFMSPGTSDNAWKQCGLIREWIMGGGRGGEGCLRINQAQCRPIRSWNHREC